MRCIVPLLAILVVAFGSVLPWLAAPAPAPRT